MDPVQRFERGSDLYWRVPVGMLWNGIRGVLLVHAVGGHVDGHLDIKLSCWEDVPKGDKDYVPGL